MSKIVNRRDLDFQLYEVLGIERLFSTERFDAFDREALSEMFDSVEAVAEDIFLPFAALLDRNEPAFRDGKAIVIPEVQAALKAYADTGLFAAGFDTEIGGLQLPYVAQVAMNGMFSAANNSVYAFAMLTSAAANVIDSFGDPVQKALYLPPMLEGRWFGTMCLSETQAGSSLADIRTQATPRPDGMYSISGTKMWISGGEHEISENIVHLVLAKLPDAPAGVRGISLFIVPKYRVNSDGSLGEKNNIALAGLNHKMGQRGLPNAVLNFGEQGESLGALVGEPHDGLRCMFQMMNEARILVGQGAAMMGLAGFLCSLEYAKTRQQGRLPDNKDPSTAPVAIVEHADVRRLLLSQKANVEGAQALILYCSVLVDRIRIATTSAERERNTLLLELLTPIAKSWPSEYCLEANKLAIQVLGGYGYTRDYDVERLYRDNRLNAIHEGAHGIHGIDLLGRKVAMQGGAAFEILLEKIGQTLAESGDQFLDHANRLKDASQLLRETTEKVLSCEDPKLRLANASLYLDAVGHIVVAWLWLEQLHVAGRGAAQNNHDYDFYIGKLAAGQFFYRYELPKVAHLLSLVGSLDRTTLDVDARQFVPS